MEASSLKIKKQIQKGKLKKTMKNIICRPDPNFWPLTTENECKILTEELDKLKIDIPEYKKPRWSELCQVPKDLRQKPPPIPKVNGLIFGISECKKAIESKECVGILIDSNINPRTIVQPLIDICLDKSIPVLCMKELRPTTDIDFGIPTSVLGIKRNILPDLEDKFLEISMCSRHLTDITEANNTEIKVQPKTETNDFPKTDHTETANVTMNELPQIDILQNDLYESPLDIINKEARKNADPDKIDLVELRRQLSCPYMYRSSKSARLFSPTFQAKLRAQEELIKLSNSVKNEETATTSNKQLLKMNVKKIASNPKRKVAKSSTKD